MQTLTPYVSCLAAPHEFEEAIKNFPEVYIPTTEGYLKHVKLRGDRFVRVKTPKLPASATAIQMVEIKEELNFLPAGRIPYSFFEQIVQFFRKVIEIKKVKLEAHAWILWSKETGYYISIPPQTVSGAAVKFEYTKESLPEGHTIVVDIH